MEKLPSEIITQILEYLPFDDRREMAMVNKVFYYASSHPVFLRKELLIYRSFEANLNHFKNFKNMLLKSKRKLLYLKFVDLTFIDDLTIFTKLGNRITSLYFNNLKSLNDSFLDAITQCCSNLEELEFKDMINFFLTDKDRKPILKLCSISLENVQITDREFNLILKLAPNLKHLSILDSHLIGGSQVVQRFYPHDNIEYSSLFNKYNSNYIFSEKNIVHHLNNSVRLNSLRLNQFCNIFYLIQPIQLEFKSLALNLKETINNQSINFEKLNLVLSQCVSLEQLEICYLPVDLLSIISKLYNLRHLTLSYSGMSSNNFDGVESLKSFMKSLTNLKCIRTLSFNRVFENNNVLLPILPFSSCILNSLTSLDCSLDIDLSVLNFGQKLTNLHIRNGDILKANDLELLFRNLTELKHLWIDKCSVLNDEIFIKLPISNLKELITLKIMQSNISQRCLQYITNSSLKVLILTNMSFESTSTLPEYNSFKISACKLSQTVPMLTHLEISISFESLKILESLNLLTYFRTNCTILIKKYFKRMKIFKIW